MLIADHDFSTRRYHRAGCDRETSNMNRCACGFIQWHVANPQDPRRLPHIDERWQAYDPYAGRILEKSMLLADPNALALYLEKLKARALVTPDPEEEV